LEAFAVRGQYKDADKKKNARTACRRLFYHLAAAKIIKTGKIKINNIIILADRLPQFFKA
jgi:hypothetical protein